MKDRETGAEVDSNMQTSKGEEFSINYKLHRLGEDWRIYDLVIENVSLINNYRSRRVYLVPARRLPDPRARGRKRWS
jgi:ABC-type transporter MlaC component